MIPDELFGVVTSLLDKARDNQVNWVSAADLGMGSESDDVVVSFPDYSINVYSGESDEDGNPFIAFNILNTKGKVIGGVSLNRRDQHFELLRDLLTIAGRKLAGLDEAIDSLQKALDQPGIVGAPPGKTRASRSEDSPF